jgi:hypothetical protein
LRTDHKRQSLSRASTVVVVVSEATVVVERDVGVVDVFKNPPDEKDVIGEDGIFYFTL